MNDSQKRQQLLIATLLVAALLLFLIYARQRLFTQTEPIVLAT